MTFTVVKIWKGREERQGGEANFISLSDRDGKSLPFKDYVFTFSDGIDHSLYAPTKINLTTMAF